MVRALQATGVQWRVRGFVVLAPPGSGLKGQEAREERDFLERADPAQDFAVIGLGASAARVGIPARPLASSYSIP